MTAILKTNGDLLVPLGECAAAERVTPGDPRYAALLPGAIPEEDLCGTPFTTAPPTLIPGATEAVLCHVWAQDIVDTGDSSHR